jgi:hypothetical protein
MGSPRNCDGPLSRYRVTLPRGQGRGTTTDFIHFLHIARGSLQEVQTQVLIAERLCVCSSQDQHEVKELAVEVARIINGLIASLAQSTTSVLTTNH